MLILGYGGLVGKAFSASVFMLLQTDLFVSRFRCQVFVVSKLIIQRLEVAIPDESLHEVALLLL